MRYDVVYIPLRITLIVPKAHHILAEIIQGGLVLETNVDEIDAAGMYGPRSSPAYILYSAKSTTGF
jgi:hypothetical protein